MKKMSAATTRGYSLIGYSLIEVLVVVAIIGVIASIAYPSYRDYVASSHRTQAVADLMACSLALERFHSNSFTYAGADDGEGICPSQSPRQGEARYTISYESLTQTDFTIRATPVGGACGSGDCIELTAGGDRTQL